MEIPDADRGSVAVRAGFERGRKVIALGDGAARQATAGAMAAARRVAPGLRPEPLGTAASFGFGDRLGLATPGHVEAMRRAGGGIAPIFAQQSVRELGRTGRSMREVIDDAQFGILAGGWSGRHGADADHLKTFDDIDRAVEAGFTLYTLDPSDRVDPRAEDYDEQMLNERFQAIRKAIDWYRKYRDQAWDLANGTVIEFDRPVVKRCAVKYGAAINRAVELSEHLGRRAGDAGLDYEVELSLDEMPRPTTLAEHFIIADQCIGKGVKLVGVAPRFIGEFEKGVDYKGDAAALERSLVDHHEISESLGPYKLSLHAGSDKLSIYPALARATRGRFHVKTAGTSYLEALRVVARCDERLFRRVVDLARQRYEADRATYHVSARIEELPAASDVKDADELERVYLDRWEDREPGRGFTAPGRQVLHCTFGSVLGDAELGAAVRRLVAERIELYTELLAEHFARHLEALRGGGIANCKVKIAN